MRILKYAGVIILGVAMGGNALPAMAQTADNMLDLTLSTFLDRPGWTHFDAGKVESDARAKLAASDGQMGPIEKALLFVDAMEPPLARSRTLLRYGQVTTETSGGTVSFIEVDRYNLGTEDVPHVAWRFDFQPRPGEVAGLRDAIRREIPNDEAAATDCLIAECLQPKSSTEGSFAWKPIAAPAGGWTVPYSGTAASGHAVSALVAAEMALALNIASADGNGYVWRGPEQPEAVTDGSPFLYFLDDRDITGNGRNDAIMGMVQLNDHAISEMWARRMDDGQAVGWQNAIVSRGNAP